MAPKHPIVTVAVAERNTPAVAVLLAAVAVMPEPGDDVENLPFSYSDLQAVEADRLQEGGREEGGFAAAAGVVRAYCEQHGEEVLRKASLKSETPSISPGGDGAHGGAMPSWSVRVY